MIGRTPIAQPPGSETRTEPARASSGPEDEDRGAHRLDEVVRGVGGADLPRGDRRGVAPALDRPRPTCCRSRRERADVGDVGQVREPDRLGGQQRRGQAGQRRVLGAGDGDLAREAGRAFD